MSFNPKNPQTVDLLLRRRSAKARRMTAPGPDAGELEKILRAGMRVPDHGKLAPWRFIVVEGEAQTRLGKAVFEAYAEETDDGGSEKHKSLQGFPSQAPVLIVVTSRIKADGPIPKWEQRLSAGAACQNMIIATHAMGYKAAWLTGFAAYSPGVKKALQVPVDDRIAGFLFLGSYEGQLKERPRPRFEDIVRYL